MTGVSGHDLTGLSVCTRDLTSVSGCDLTGLSGCMCDLTGVSRCDLLFGINWLLLWKPKSIILMINA